MKHIGILLTAIVFTATAGVRAQAPVPQMQINQTANGIITTQSKTYNAGSIPYSSQTEYDGMGSIPQYRAEPSIPGHMGVLGEKWETDKRGRRSTFIHNGREMSVGYDQQTNGPINKTQSTGVDSLINRNVHFPRLPSDS